MIAARPRVIPEPKFTPKSGFQPSQILGAGKWSAKVDKDGFIDYQIIFRVLTDPTLGPTGALLTPGLPVYGTPWVYLNDFNPWAYCRWETDVQPASTNEPNDQWEITYTFSNRWPSIKRGDRPYSDQPPGDPRLDPPKISGNFTRYSEEAAIDRFGNFITNSAWELVRGPHVEFDRNRPQIKIEFNSPYLPLTLLTVMTDTVNAIDLWGLPPRTIKLSEAGWELSFFGQGQFYYKITLTFDINFGTWDRDIMDEGTKVLSGAWDNATGGTGNYVLKNVGGQQPDPTNPQHFIKFKDRNGDPTQVVLDGYGLPAGVSIGTGATYYNSYMCLSANQGVTPPNPSSWLPVISPVSTKVGNFTAGVYYAPGSVVVYDPSAYGAVGSTATYVCTKKNSGVLPGQGPSYWFQVPEGTVPKNLGIYDPQRTYFAGEVVSGKVTFGTDSGPPGVIHVEKYDESDFTLLGIPLTFPLAF